MKKSFMKVFMLFVVLSLLITGCNNSKNTQDTTQNSQTDTADKSASDKSSGSSSKKTLAQAVNKDIESFTSKYIDMYNQEGNAFVKVVFEDLSFLPEEVIDNVKFFDTTEGENADYYSLVVNLEDDVLYRVLTSNYEIYDESMVGSVYLSKGDCFVIASNDEDTAKTVNIKAFNMNNSTFAEEYVYNDLEYVSPHHVALWEKMIGIPLTNKETISIDDAYIYETNESIDLDGDGVEEKLYYSILNDLNETSENYYRDIVKSLYINDKEYDLVELGMREDFDDSYEKYYYDEISSIEIIDIDEKDDYKEILIKKLHEVGHGEATKVFHYKDGQLEHIGTIISGYPIEYSNLVNDGKLTINKDGHELFFSYLYEETYSLKNGKLEKEDKKDIIDIYNFGERITVSLLENINFYEKPDSKEPMEVLEKDDILLFLETDEKGWIKVKSFNTGKMGYLIFEKDEENFRLKFKDQEKLSENGVYEVFKELPAWN